MAMLIKKKPAANPAPETPAAPAAAPAGVAGAIKKPAVGAEPPLQEEAAEAAEATHTTVAQGKATVTTHHPDGSEETTQEAVGDPVSSETPMASVTVSMGMTKNLGDYNSLKFSVSVTLPCMADADEVETTYESAKGWVEDKVTSIQEEIDQQLGN